MYRLFIALRYLLHKRISLLGVIAVAISVAVLFVVHSVMTGWTQLFQSYARDTMSDLTISKFGDAFTGYEEAMARCEKIPHVKAVSPRLEAWALVKTENREFKVGRFQGIDLERETRTTRLADYWRRAASDEHEPPSEPNWGEHPKPGVAPAIVGADLAAASAAGGKIRSLRAGDKLVLVTGSDRRVGLDIQECAIAGTFKSGLYEYDSNVVLIPLPEAQDFLRKPRRITRIAVRIDDYRNVREVQTAILGVATLDELERLRELLQAAGRLADPPVALPAQDKFHQLLRNYVESRAAENPLGVRTMLQYESACFEMMDRLRNSGALEKYSRVQELKTLRDTLVERHHNSVGWTPGDNYDFFLVRTCEDNLSYVMSFVNVQRAIAVIVQSFVFLLTGALIYSILSSSVVEKTKDVGILRSLGATRHGVMSIFLLNALIMAFVGSIVGIIAGTIICNNINRIADWIYWLTGFRVFTPEIFRLDRIPVDSDPTQWAILIAAVALAVSLAAALIPAHRAARVNPVEALRYE